MEKKYPRTKENNFFILAGIFFVMLAGGFFVLSLIGFFELLSIGLVFLLSGLTVFYLQRRYDIIPVISFQSAWVLFFCAIVAFIYSSFSAPTVFSGRDQGSIGEAAIRLAQNGSLKWSTLVSDEFFKIYGPGKALNFPGFYYTNDGQMISQFPLPYISWLAAFYKTFGFYGIVLANAFAVFFSLSFFYAGLRLYGQKFSVSAAGTFSLAVSFPIFWFSKFTLSENLFAPVLWIVIFFLTIFIKKPIGRHFIFLYVSGALLFFVRVEGLLLFPLALAIAFWTTRKSDFWVEMKKPWIVGGVFLFAILGFFVLQRSFPFYKEVLKALLFSENGSLSLTIFDFWETVIGKIRLWLAYGILPVFLSGIFGILFFLRNRTWKVLIPFFLTAPTLVYLFNGHISADHPWSLRRLYFSVLTIFCFYTFVLIGKMEKSKMVTAIFLSLIFFSFGAIPFFRYAFYVENVNYLENMEILGGKFSDLDLILIDREAGGDGWNIPSGPLNFLYDKQAVYFFNPQDYFQIDKSRFGRIFLIAPEKNIDFWKKSVLGNKMVFFESYVFSVSRLKISENSSKLPKTEEKVVRGSVFEIQP